MKGNQGDPGQKAEIIFGKAVGKQNACRGGEQDKADGPLTHRANLAERQRPLQPTLAQKVTIERLLCSTRSAVPCAHPSAERVLMGLDREGRRWWLHIRIA